ncbi:hypothetical protein DFH11DRAFT_1564563 [Phellopilus nigrolimitatus]|nr:hypothetical protein DFH11DRAFT_1564563 [Phellopilus nigrolimitatus]
MLCRRFTCVLFTLHSTRFRSSSLTVFVLFLTGACARSSSGEDSSNDSPSSRWLRQPRTLRISERTISFDSGIENEEAVSGYIAFLFLREGIMVSKYIA